MCQAKDGVGCEDGVAADAALHPGKGADTEELLAWAIHTIRTIKDRSSGERHPYWTTPEAVTRSRLYIADHCDAVLPRLEAAISQSQDEERGTRDEVDAAG